MNHLKFVRESIGMSQYQLAKITKLTQRTISRVENGYSSPQNATERKLLKGLGIPWEFREWMFHGERGVES